jgi:Protein of unknown function (DUF1360)
MTTGEQTGEYGGYAALTGTFLIGTGAAVAALAQRRRLPDHVSLGDIALLGVATYQISRTLTRDRVTAFLRAPFAREQDPAGRGEVHSEPRGDGARRAVGELVICPFCMTQWVGAAFLVGLCAAPRPTRFAASLAALRTVAEVVNIAHEAAVAHVDQAQDVAELLAKRKAAA